MPVFRWALPVALSLGVGACAIHPLPENVTGVRTNDIVHRIRCEARDAVREAERRLTMRHPQAVPTLKAIAIVYSFSLEGTETNGFTPSATVVTPLPNGMWSYNPSAGDTVKRDNVRTFTIIDNYGMLQNMDPNRCAAEPMGPNYQYPIVGKIGIEEMIMTFVALSLHTDIQQEEGVSIAGGNELTTTTNGPPTMVDTISFTTTLSAGITPMLTLTPVGSATQLSGASLGISLMRNDVHQVIIGLALPSLPARPALALPNHAHFGMLVSGATRNTVEAAALDAVNSQIIRFQLTRPLIVTP